MKEVALELTWLDIIFLGLAVVSLVMNIYQWLDRKRLELPLRNSALALFNDIKAKTGNIQFMNGALFNPNNPHKDIETLRWEYGLFQQAMYAFLQGFQENVVAILVTLSPGDREGKQAFRASDYGLTKFEKEGREAYQRQLLEQHQPPDLDRAPPAAEDAPSQADDSEESQQSRLGHDEPAEGSGEFEEKKDELAD